MEAYKVSDNRIQQVLNERLMYAHSKTDVKKWFDPYSLKIHKTERTDQNLNPVPIVYGLTCS